MVPKSGYELPHEVRLATLELPDGPEVPGIAASDQLVALSSKDRLHPKHLGVSPP